MNPAALFGVGEWDEFRRAFVQCRTIVRAQGAAPGRFQSLWSDWELDAACRFTPVPHHAHFRLLMKGKRISPATFTSRSGEFREEAFRQVRRAGASVAFGNFENFSNPALALSRALEAEFRLPVQVNVYATPPGQQGLGVHVDPHDVLILQIQGEKEWDIYDEVTGGSAEQPGTITLRQGGWLFLPKGTRHEVRNRGTAASLHFTVGFHPLTWGEVFQRALTQGRVATRALNERLPFGVAVEGSPEQMSQRLASILDFVDLRECEKNYYAGFPALMVAVPPAGLIERGALDALEETTRLRWNAEAHLGLTAEGNPQISLDYRRFPLGLQPSFAPVLARMREAAGFTAAQLPLDERPVALLLCKFLTGLGVLHLAG